MYLFLHLLQAKNDEMISPKPAHGGQSRCERPIRPGKVCRNEYFVRRCRIQSIGNENVFPNPHRNLLRVYRMDFRQKFSLATASVLPCSRFPLIFLKSEDQMRELGLSGTPETLVVDTGARVEKVWPGAYLEPTRTEMEKYFGLALPNVSTEAATAAASVH